MSFCIKRKSENVSGKFPIKNIILCYLSGFHWLSNRQRLHRKYSFSQINLNSILVFCPFSPLLCPSILNLALIWLVWMFCPKQSTLICPYLELSFHVEREFSFMFQSFIEFLSSCPFQPTPLSPLLQKISSQSNNSPDKFNIAPVNIADVRFFGHKENHLIKVNVLFVLFAVWYWKWWG